MTDFTNRLNSLIAEPSRDTPDNHARLARVERTRTEFFGQADAIRHTLAAAEAPLAELSAKLKGRTIDRIVIAGCGDSWFAGAAMRHALETLTQRPVEGAQALDFACYGARAGGAGTLCVGISSSGNTPAVMGALRAAAREGATCVGISNTAGSPILTEFDAALMVHATRKGWPTQSTNATMALLVALGLAVAKDASAAAELRDELEALPAVIERISAGLDEPMAAIAQSWAGSDLVLFTGLGPSFAAASIGAAKLRELSPVHAFAMPLEEYHHYRSQKAGDPIVLVATDAASQDRALDTALVAEHVGGPLLAILSKPAPEIAARAQAVIHLPETSAALGPMLSILPLHLLAYHYAIARAARGLGAPARLA